jgi:guanylate kinase
MDYPGNLFVIAAPSGAGKSSLVKQLLQTDANLHLSVSHTTRAPRGQEEHAREYYFVSDREFDEMVLANAFVEWAHVHNHRYGTSKMAIDARIASGGDVILEIDFQGAQQIKQLFANAQTLFILPPSYEELKLRLLKRGEDAPDVIETRLQNARLEVAQAEKFDFVIINDSFDSALADLRCIVRSQRLKFAAQRRTRADTFKTLNIA